MHPSCVFVYLADEKEQASQSNKSLRRHCFNSLELVLDTGYGNLWEKKLQLMLQSFGAFLACIS